MRSQVVRLAMYRFRATFRRRRGGYLALVLLIGLLGGIAMGSIAAGRRTQSSFASFLASTNPSDLVVTYYQPGSQNGVGAPEAQAAAIAHLAGVKRVERYIAINALPLAPNGAPDPAALNASVNTFGSVDGLDFNQDRLTAVQGRMADPNRADEVVMTADAARQLGLHVGAAVPFGFYSNEQTGSPDFGTPKVRPLLQVDVKLVGLVTFNYSLVQDDVDRLSTAAVFTPTLTGPLLAQGGIGGAGSTYYGLQLVHGSRDVGAVEKALHTLDPPRTGASLAVTSLYEAKVERAIKPESIALAVFGAIAAIAALLIAAQAISRLLRADDEDLVVLRALGASQAMTVADQLIGTLGAVTLGSLAAVGVAVGLSPLSPLGAVRPVYPHPGVALDWTVLGIGLLLLIGGLAVTTLGLSYRGAPHRAARQSRLIARRPSSAVRVAASSGLSAPAVIGVRFALEPGRGRTAVPVRSALLGATMAVLMMVATITFGSGLHKLVSSPALYGWNWTYALTIIGGGPVPPPALALLDHDPLVSAWTGESNSAARIDGQVVPALFQDTHASLTPPILSGHALTGPDQIVLGAATLAQLHKHVGDTVVFTHGSPVGATLYVPSTPLVIVGTATMPVVGPPLIAQDHLSMGTGALLSVDVFPAAVRQAHLNPDPNLNGPSPVFVRLRAGVSPVAGRADMQRIADEANKAVASDPNASGNVVVLGVQRPAEIVNYRSVGATPAVLAAGLAAGATVALGLTLATSVRRRRRDLALLKALGFTRRQLSAAVAWQASMAAVVGVAVGVPLGVALGRQLWILFARNIYAVPQPTVPALSVVLVAVAALLFANVVAALPGRLAARTPAALVLRAE